MRALILLSLFIILAGTYAYPSSSTENFSRKKSFWWYVQKAVSNIARKIWHLNDKCHGLDCPKYTVEKSTDDYELRCYPRYTWVGTTYSGDNWPNNRERRDMFMRLFDYIQGENADRIKIKMTVPVATKVEQSSQPQRYTMLFFVPYKYQSSPPQPTNPQVSIVQLPKTCVYVKSFSWNTEETNVEKNLKELEDALKKDGISDYADPNSVYIYGGYDSPMTLPFMRTNEVWLIQQNS